MAELKEFRKLTQGIDVYYADPPSNKVGVDFEKTATSGSTNGVTIKNMEKTPCKVGVDLVFRDIGASLGGRKILENVSGMVGQGTMLAIMGSSGAGKTTLFNVLAGRVKSYSGDVMINNQPVTKQHRRGMGYALQEDTFFSNLTLRQTLEFTAGLRLSDKLSKQEKSRRLEVVVEKMDLKKCLDTAMGGVFKPGLSGGERKRANIACELLSDPMLMLIDEPTSGLDAALAFQIMATLESYASEENKTIVTTIHQPSSQIFHMFQNVLLLANGQVAYYGPSRNILDFFSNVGLHCSPSYNPADFILDNITKDHDTTHKLIDAMYTYRKTDKYPLELRSRNQEKDRKCLTGSTSFDPHRPTIPKTQPQKWPTSFSTQYLVLARRNFIQSGRNKFGTLQIMQQVVFALSLMMLWFRMPRNLDYVDDRKSVVFISMMFSTYVIPSTVILGMFEEKSVITKERLSGAYRLSAYYLSKITTECLIIIVYPTLQWLLIYFLVGLVPAAKNFFHLLLAVYILNSILLAYGIAFGVLFRDVRVAMVIAMVVGNINILGAGWYQQNFQGYLEWIPHVTFLGHVYDITLHNEFTYGPDFSCEGDLAGLFPECGSDSNTTAFNYSKTTMRTVPGSVVLEKRDSVLPIWINYTVLLTLAVLLYIGVYILLRLKGAPIEEKQSATVCCIPTRCFRRKSSEGDKLKGKDKIISMEQGVSPYTLTFSDVCVELGGTEILREVSGSVDPGSMVAILGPSGIGKSTLLNVISGRIRDYTGAVCINGEPINKSHRRKIAYIMQEDVFFKNLTLRQTLKFSAQLKLPEEWSIDQREQEIEKIVTSLELHRCLDTVMVSLSGGEKKRANIACELLADPSVLLIDEPTSGLDSALAYKLMLTIKSLASEGNKTILTSIHQPSSQLFHMFDKIILLGNKQVAYYGPPGSVVGHFSSLGLECDPLYNPADYIMEQLRKGSEVVKTISEKANEYKKKGLWYKELRSAVAKDNIYTIDLNVDNNNTSNHGNQLTVSTNGYSNGLSNSKAAVKRSEEVDLVEDQKWPSGFLSQYWTLTQRNLAESKSRVFSKTIFAGQTIQAILIGICFWQLPVEERTIRDLEGMIAKTTGSWGYFLMTDAVISFSQEYTVVTKERLSRTFRLSSYWLAKMTSELALLLILPTISWVIIYSMVGLPADFWLFLSTLLVVILAALMAQSLGLLIGCSIPNPRSAFSFSLIIFLPTWVGTGLFSSKPRWYFAWLEHVSFLKYTYHLFLQAVLSWGVKLRCLPRGETKFSECISQYISTSGNNTMDYNSASGNNTMKYNNSTLGGDFYASGGSVMDEIDQGMFPIWVNIMVPLMYIVLLRTALYFVLKYYRNPSRN